MRFLFKMMLAPISLFVAFLALMAKWLLTLSSYVVAPLMLYIFGCGIYTVYRQTWDQFLIDKSRVLKFVGHLSPENMRRVDDAVKISLALNPMGSIQKLKPIIRSQAAYAPPEVVDGKPPIYPYTPIKSSFEDAGSVEEMMVYTELQSAVHAMIQRLEYSFTFNPSLLTIPKRKQQVAEILEEAEKYIWRIKEEMRCA